MSDCAVKGFVRNAMHPESKAAVRTAGLSLAVINHFGSASPEAMS